MPYLNNRLNILLVLPFFYPHRGGAQKYAEELYAKLLKKYRGLRVDVLCYNSDDAPYYEEYRGMRIYRVPCYTFLPGRFLLPKPFALFRVLKLLANNNYDYVNTHSRFFDPTWWLWIYAKYLGAKSIFTGHVASHPIHENKVVQIISYIVDSTLARFSLKFYDFHTFTNIEALRFFRDKLGVHRPKYLIYGGVDTDFFYPASKHDRVIPKINRAVADESILVTFVGRITWTKGITYLLDSINQLYKRYPKSKLRFVIAGPGDLEDYCKNFVKNKNLEKRLILTGNLSYTQVRDLLSISDVFINPSHHSEGFPNTILEAGASGCFIIATDNAGTKEVVVNNKTGFLVPQKTPEAYIKSLIWAEKHPAQRKIISNNMRKLIVAKHSWSTISKIFYNLLHSGRIDKKLIYR